MTKLYLYCSVYIASSILAITSIAISWSSPMLPKLNGTDDNPLGRRLTNMEVSFITAVPKLSIPIGSLVCGFLSTKFGRKPLLLTLGVSELLFFLLLAFAKNIFMIGISTIGLGFINGAASILTAIYCSELAEPKNRGTLMISLLIIANIGTIIVLCFGPYLSYFSFHIIPISLCLIYLPLLYFFSIESPFYLIGHDLEETRKVLKKIRNFDEIEENIEIIKKNTQPKNNTNNENILDILKSNNVKKAVISVLGMVLFSSFTGLTVVSSYTQTIFEIANENSNGIDPKLCPIIIELTSFITNILFSTFVDSFPRKTLLKISFFCVALAEIPFSLFFILKNDGVDMSSFSLVPLVSLMMCIICLNIGVSPISNIYLDEVFPFRAKGIIIPMMMIVGSIITFGITFSFTFLNDLIGMGYVFLVFSFMCFIAPIYVHFLVIETKGKSLQQIQDEFEAWKKK